MNEMFGNWNSYAENSFHDQNENHLNSSHIYDSFTNLNENGLTENKSPFDNSTLVRSAYDWNKK